MHRQKNKRKNVVDVDDVYIDQQGSSKGKTGTLEDEMTILSRGFNSVAGDVESIIEYFSSTESHDADFKKVVEFLSTQLVLNIENIRSSFLTNATDDMIEKMDYLGVCLWNESLGFDLDTKGDEEVLYLIANLKSAGYILIELASSRNMDNYGRVRMINLATRVSKGWYRCKNIDKLDQCGKFLQIGEKYRQELPDRFIRTSPQDDVTRVIFSLDIGLMELEYAKGNDKRAMLIAKKLLASFENTFSDLEEEMLQLLYTLFRFAYEKLVAENYHQSIEWSQAVFDFLEKGVLADLNVETNILMRDVRKCYTSALICRGEQQDLGTALENLKVLMNDGDNDFEKCYLAFKIASKTRDLSIDLKSLFMETMSSTPIVPENSRIFLAIVSLASSSLSIDTILDGINLLLKSSDSASCLEKVLAIKFSLLFNYYTKAVTNGIEGERKKAMKLVEKLCGTDDGASSVRAIKTALLLHHASEAFKRKHFNDSVTFLKLCEGIMSEHADAQIALAIHQNLALCYMQMENYDEAAPLVAKCKRLVQSKDLKLMNFYINAKSSSGLEELQNAWVEICEFGDLSTKLEAVQIAFKAQKPELLKMVMKNLPEMLPEEDIKVRLFIERFMVNLLEDDFCTSTNLDVLGEIGYHLKSALQIIKSSRNNEAAGLINELVEFEIEWFWKFAWNLACLVGEKEEIPLEVQETTIGELYRLCKEFLIACSSPNVDTLWYLATCYLLNTIDLVSRARASKEFPTKELDFAAFRHLSVRIRELLDEEESSVRQQSLQKMEERMALLEMELSILSENWDQVKILSQSIAKDTSVEVLESIADTLCHDIKVPNRILISVIKLLLETTLSKSQLNPVKFGKWIIVLLNAILSGATWRKSLSWFQQVERVVKETQGFPNDDKVWLSNTCWNTALRAWNVGDSDLARNFIKVSKSILEYVENKQDLQERMDKMMEELSIKLDE